MVRAWKYLSQSPLDKSTLTTILFKNFAWTMLKQRWQISALSIQHTEVHSIPVLEEFHPCTGASQQDDTDVPCGGQSISNADAWWTQGLSWYYKALKYDISVTEHGQHFRFHGRAPFHLLQDVMQGEWKSIAILLHVTMLQVLNIPPAEITGIATQYTFLKRAVKPLADKQSATRLLHVSSSCCLDPSFHLGCLTQSE